MANHGDCYGTFRCRPARRALHRFDRRRSSEQSELSPGRGCAHRRRSSHESHLDWSGAGPFLVVLDTGIVVEYSAYRVGAKRQKVRGACGI